MAHDFLAQRAETFRVYEELQAEHGLPDIADIDYFLVADREGADWKALARDLDRQGYDCSYVGEDAETPCLVATLPDQPVSAQGIWIGEEIATRHAFEHGFRPDGWGMET